MMKFKRFAALWISVYFLCHGSIAADMSLESQVKSLEPIIGGYPPAIHSKAELDGITQTYLNLKSELDDVIEKSPGNQAALILRGQLQSMGHNFDFPRADEGAVKDFQEALQINPKNVMALVGLGTFWVNSDMKMAPKAEELFRQAQCYSNKIPNEGAQRGIYFALYYQGKMQEAYVQSEYLKATWPMMQTYSKLNETVKSVLARNNQIVEVPASSLQMATCQK